jgi:hypothetical protein
MATNKTAKTRKTEDEMIEEERQQQAMALEIAAELSKAVFGDPYSLLEVFDRLAWENNQVLPDQKELEDHLKQSIEALDKLHISASGGDRYRVLVFGTYDRIFGMSTDEKLNEILDSIE